MSATERTVYTGAIFFLFALFSPGIGVATISFLVVLGTSFLTALLIRDFSRYFSATFTAFFYVFVVLVILFSLLSHHTSMSIPTPMDGIVLSSVPVIAGVGVLVFISHQIFNRCLLETNESFSVGEVNRETNTVDDASEDSRSEVENDVEDYTDGE